MSLIAFFDGLIEAHEAGAPDALAASPLALARQAQLARLLKTFKFAAVAPEPPETSIQVGGTSAQEALAASLRAEAASNEAPRVAEASQTACAADIPPARATSTCEFCQRHFGLKKTLGLHRRVCTGLI